MSYPLDHYTVEFLHHFCHNSYPYRDQMSYSCTYCPKKLINMSKRDLHIRAHTGERSFLCSLCTKAFSKEGDLKRHIRIHAGEKPFACSRCPTAFSEGEYLKNYLRTHSGYSHFLVINVLGHSHKDVI